jgi:Protein of unknown function (DUF3891)
VVLRRDGAGVLAVGQAAHAWVCGQLARAWGNARFGAVIPLHEVALGAEQHDVGMARWDLHPVRNPDTGLPLSFIEMGVADNVALWRAGPERLVTQSRYAALLAAMHGRRLYERRDLEAAPAEEAEIVRHFLNHSHALETTLRDALQADPVAAPSATDALIARNSQLLWTWDSLSLGLLLNWAPFTLHAVPTADAADDGEGVDVHLGPDGTLDPWPFSGENPIAVHCDARRLAGDGYDSDAALERGLADAPWETVRFDLQPPAARAPTI